MPRMMISLRLLLVSASALLLIPSCYATSKQQQGQTDVTFCDNSVIQVISMYLTCDSPGTYYYGSGGYRNSPTCKFGDNGHFSGSFRITGDIGDTESIYVSTELDIFGRTKQIVTQTELCSIDSLTMTADDDYTPECPSQGVVYSFEKYFTIPTSSYLSSVYFTPSVQVSFASDSTQGSMDLGCAISSEGAEMGKAPSSGIALSSAKKWVLGVGFTFLAACMSVLVFFALRRRPDEPIKNAPPKYQVTMVTRKQKMSGFEYRGDAISA